jgi:integrase
MDQPRARSGYAHRGKGSQDAQSKPSTVDGPIRCGWCSATRLSGTHDLRHACVSLLLDLGVPPHVVKEIVGHSAIDVTMTIYAHASLDSKRAALKLLDERLSEAN